jgi:hypothetical protein
MATRGASPEPTPEQLVKFAEIEAILASGNAETPAAAQLLVPYSADLPAYNTYKRRNQASPAPSTDSLHASPPLAHLMPATTDSAASMGSEAPVSHHGSTPELLLPAGAVHPSAVAASSKEEDEDSSVDTKKKGCCVTM